jgi:hypothetical protein
MALLTKLPDLAKSFAAHKLVDELVNKANPTTMTGVGLLFAYDKKPVMWIINEMKKEAVENPNYMCTVVGGALTNKLLEW